MHLCLLSSGCFCRFDSFLGEGGLSGTFHPFPQQRLKMILEKVHRSIFFIGSVHLVPPEYDTLTGFQLETINTMKLGWDTLVCLSNREKLSEHLRVNRTLGVKTPQDGADMKVNRKESVCFFFLHPMSITCC